MTAEQKQQFAVEFNFPPLGFQTRPEPAFQNRSVRPKSSKIAAFKMIVPGVAVVGRIGTLILWRGVETIQTDPIH